MFPISGLFTLNHPRFLSKTVFLRRLLSTHSPIEHTLSHPIYTIWGANTGVGKTLVSAGLATAFLSPHSPPSKFIYIKPLQTGFPSDSDSTFVYRKFSEIFLHRQSQSTVFASNHTLKVSIPAANDKLRSGSGVEFEKGGEFGNGFKDFGFYEEKKLQIERGEEVGGMSELICKTMYGWREAVSPHLAAEREGTMVGDSELLGMLKSCLEIGLGSEGGEEHKVGGVLTVVETAGGVASPGPSGSLQCDLYRCVIM